MLLVSMERVATLLGLTWLLFLLRLSGTQASGIERRLSHSHPLPPCDQVPGGISGWDCYDPPNQPLPPCDYLHPRIGVDCSGWRSVSPAGAGTASPTTALKSKTRPLLGGHIAIDLPPCSQNPGGDDTPDSWKCLTSRPVPGAEGSDVYVGEASPATAEGKSDTTAATTTVQEKGSGHVIVEGELPACSEVAHGIPGWDCYDPPQHPLPPCDFLHQRIGFDCSGWPPRRLLLTQ